LSMPRPGGPYCRQQKQWTGQHRCQNNGVYC
jgi:hypothetical protein